MSAVFHCSCTVCMATLVHLYRMEGRKKIGLRCRICGAEMQFDLEGAFEKLDKPAEEMRMEGVILAPNKGIMQ